MKRRLTAAIFLVIFSVELFIPGVSYALTSGPTQPEMQKFTPAGVSDLVDLFTGDFKYNIPLLDVGGYPVNLSYHSESGIEDEASWVGMGWTLNPGAVNRNLRGLPDDFKGDLIRKEYHQKPWKKIGGNVIIKPSALAWEFGKASIKLGVYKDNYWGMGAEVGAGLELLTTIKGKHPLTAGLDLDITSNTQSGVNLKPTFSLEALKHNGEFDMKKVSGELTYNTRRGLDNFSLSASFSSKKFLGDLATVNSSFAKYFGQEFKPSFEKNIRRKHFTFNLDGGLTLFGFYVGPGGQAYYEEEYTGDPTSEAPAYGYLYHNNGRKNVNALIDGSRENDGPFDPSVPAIPVPVATHDFFTATSQAGSQQFRPFYAGNFVMFDRRFTTSSDKVEGFGATIGGGNAFKGGGRLKKTKDHAASGKWILNNQYLEAAEPAFTQAKPDEEAVYFKQVGEPTKADESYFTQIRNHETQGVTVNDISHYSPQATAYKAFKTRTGSISTPPAIRKNDKEVREHQFSYLTADKAQFYALDRTINGEQRVNVIRQPHHISEITTIDNEGKRMVYGIPVYNTYREEVSFSVDKPTDLQAARKSGLIPYPAQDATMSNRKGRLQIYSREQTPPYATSYLLTAILSPDYVDVTGDGISDDDLGTAVKFNYTRTTSEYKWRAPYSITPFVANYNEGKLTDAKDDQANYDYGQKEIWYLESIESKTMIAVFERSDREDALAAAGPHGGRDLSLKLKKLDKIKLYSKADYINGANPIPIKTVVFEYDYSLYPGVPNNTERCIDKDGQLVGCTDITNVNASKGKLTLKKLYFMFGQSSRGQTNPYEFQYDMRLIKDADANLPANPSSIELNDNYATRQQDRWGTYKQPWYNHLTSNPAINGKLNNSEFSYSLQENANTSFSERKIADAFASKWQLNRIVSPTNSTIEIVYEADDYAYVQNKRAMQMCFVRGIGPTANVSDGLIEANDLLVELPFTPLNEADFQRRYLEGVDNIFYRFYTDLDHSNHYEFVNGYAEIDAANSHWVQNTNTATIRLKKVKGYNPISFGAWQTLRTELPQLAYDGYDNTNISNDLVAAVTAIVKAVLNMREIFQPFDKHASKRKFGDRVELSKCMIRLNNPDFKKIGGGMRVKEIMLVDNWLTMDGSPNAKTSKYGQVYDYTMKGTRGEILSSGVASYEPQFGNEENPFHQPLNYVEKVHWALDKYHHVEQPFCESYFPAPSVGYSKVTVISVGDDYVSGNVPAKHTGQIENDFYTAKDFPTVVDFIPLTKTPIEKNLSIFLFASTHISKYVTSQGFKIELNDMHGKPKSVEVFNKAGDKLSSTEYFYNVDNENDAEKKLLNKVEVLERGGAVELKTMATDMDFVTDARESISESVGTNIGAYPGGMVLPFFVPFYWGYGAINFNQERKQVHYNSMSAIKVIHRFGLVKKVRTMQNGSTLESENLLWDAETGQVVLTRTQNEFDDYTYSFSYPAHMVDRFQGMSGSWKTSGNILISLSTTNSGVISSANTTSNNIGQYLSPGDELININPNSDEKGWVIKSNDDSYRLIDANGNFIVTSGNFMVLRSGRRNITSASAGSVICMKNPVVTEPDGSKHIDVSAANGILDSKAIEYKDEWALPVAMRFTSPSACSDAYPETELGGNFFVENTSPSNVDCSGSYVATSIRTEGGNSIKGRSFLDFFVGTSELPQGAIVQSVKLSLYSAYPTKPHIGANTSVLRRVIEDKYCSNSDWNTQAATTDEGQILLPQSTSADQDYTDLDVTQMFKDWKTSQPNSQLFKMQLSLVNESAGAQRQMYFLGWTSAENPRLDICYTLPQCVNPVDKPINPFYTGLLGNWRIDKNYVFTVNREQKPGAPGQAGGTNIRRSGNYIKYNNFWAFNSGQLTTAPIDNSDGFNRWIWSNRSVYYDEKGNEVENVDALNRYGAALFGYQQSAAIAVAANARRNEIMFDGFEDYKFNLSANPEPQNCPTAKHFDFGIQKNGDNYCGSSGCVVYDEAHTGKYSYHLTSTINITKPAGNASPPTTPLLSWDGTGRYILQANEQANGFGPIYTTPTQKKYVFSMWVKDGNPNSNLVSGFTLLINGAGPDFSKPVPVVEGWKRIEYTFSANSTFNIQMTGGANIYIDDIRIFPFDGHMNSFVYDERTMRLMAQLDENNFATFYEYDDEGTPVRVKKETDRGIMTLKENRQSFKNR